ncbi:hypothetical protein DRE_06763 [Drechslerella stenobrocha 248]|uniref:Saccharopine dehydrogenase NADP binding domain-containing protein n=1 Tax=Drechslerella stenobrocha 248 TaxID=1043628 RepID=W7I6Q4_9PEZI|nr:hypothetical protein DRE_06763 [Drechslerella stenobrocha 248]
MPPSAALDLVLFGATGFTGWISAQYIARLAPRDLRWALAARSPDKLAAKLEELGRQFPDRVPPETIVAGLDEASAVKLAGSCKLVISTVGPFCRYGSELVKACAEAGTHYVDCTGEHTWVLDMIEKYDETARRTGALIIPQTAFESAPADLVSYKIAQTIREKYNLGTKDVTFSLHNLNGGASGGTIETFLSVIEVFGVSRLASSSQPLALSPAAVRTRPFSVQTRTPVFTHPVLGTLTSWLQATPDRAIVMRSWGLAQLYAPETLSYGANFAFAEFKRARNALEGLVVCVAIAVVSVGVLFAPFRWLARRVVMQPGFGPDQAAFNSGRQGSLEWRAVGVADDSDYDGEGRTKKREVLASLRYEDGDCYAITALLIVEAAFTILDLQKDGGVGEDCLARKIGGGVLTPACLGEPYIKRLDAVGTKLVVKEL